MQQEWFATSILQNALFRFQVVRIHKGAVSPEASLRLSYQQAVQTHVNGQIGSQSRESEHESKQKKSHDDHPKATKEPPSAPIVINQSKEQGNISSRDTDAAQQMNSIQSESNHDTNESDHSESKSNEKKQERNEVKKSNEKNQPKKNTVVDLASSESESDAISPKPIEKQPTADDPPRPLYEIGTKLQKKFLDDSIGKRRYYKGEVVAYDPSVGFYQIRYEDG